MKKIVIAILAVLALLAGALLGLPSLVDWNGYRAQIAERVTAATGRAVELKGDVGLSILPTPAFTVRDARLANAAGAAEPDMVRLKKLDVRVALGPLLGGRIQVESIALVEPTVVVEILPDGRLNWDLSADRSGARAAGKAGDGIVSSVSFDQVSVERGTILYRDDRSGRIERLDDVNARVVAGSLTGPFQVQGTFALRNTPVRTEITAGRFTEGAAVPLRVSLGLQDSDAMLRFAGIIAQGNAGPANTGSGTAGQPAAPAGSGTAGIGTAGSGTAGSGPRAQGDLRAEGGDLGRVLALIGADGSPALAQPFNLRTAMEATTAAASFSNLEVQLGDTRASGSASLRTGTPTRAELTLALNRLDVDSWKARFSTGAPAAASDAQPSAPPPVPPAADGTQATTAPTGADRPARRVPELPEAIDLKLDLSADGITYNGSVVRQGRIEATLSRGRLNVDRFSALLPGGSDLVAAGELTTPGGLPTMDLRLEANADNLRALLDWMKLDTRSVPADRLRRASLAARVVGTPGRFEVGGLDLRIDTSRLSGAVAYVDRGRPAFGARLELDRLNLDAYLPPDADAPAAPAAQPSPPRQPQKPAQKGSRPTAQQADEPAALRLLKTVDANLDLTVGQLTVRGLPVQGIRLDATVAGGGVTIREARIDDFIGLKGRLDGQVASLSPLRGANLALTAEAASLSSLPSAVAWPPGIPAPERLGAVQARGRVAGDAERLAVEVNARIAEATLEAGGALLALETDPAADLKLRLTHPEIGRVAALFNDGQPARAYGPLDLYGELHGPRKMPVLGNIQGIVAGVPLRGRANANLTGSRPRVEADLQTGDLDITRLAAAPVLASRVDAGGPSGRTDAAAGPAPAADAPARFDLGWMRTFDGRLALTPASLLVGDTRIDEPALRATLDNGVLKLEEFDGSWAGGQIWANGKLVAAQGALPAMDGTVTVSKAKLDQLAGLSGLGFAGGSADLEATLATMGDSGDALLRGLTGKGRVAARDGLLTGLDFAAIRDRLTRIDRPQEVLGALAGGLQGGQTRFGRLDGTFTVRNGVARTEDTRAVTDAGEAAVVGQVSLPDGTVDARMRVTVAANPPLPPLSLRISGPLAAPTRSLEMQEMQDYFARRAGEALKPNLPVPNLQGVPANPEGLIRGLIDGLKR